MREPSNYAICDASSCREQAKMNVRVRVKGIKPPLGDIYVDLCATHHIDLDFDGEPLVQRVYF